MGRCCLSVANNRDTNGTVSVNPDSSRFPTTIRLTHLPNNICLFVGVRKKTLRVIARTSQNPEKLARGTRSPAHPAHRDESEKLIPALKITDSTTRYSTYRSHIVSSSPVRPRTHAVSIHREVDCSAPLFCVSSQRGGDVYRILNFSSSHFWSGRSWRSI